MTITSVSAIVVQEYDVRLEILTTVSKLQSETPYTMGDRDQRFRIHCLSLQGRGVSYTGKWCRYSEWRTGAGAQLSLHNMQVIASRTYLFITFSTLVNGLMPPAFQTSAQSTYGAQVIK